MYEVADRVMCHLCENQCTRATSAMHVAGRGGRGSCILGQEAIAKLMRHDAGGIGQMQQRHCM